MLEQVKHIAKEAGKIILDYRKKGFSIETKKDDTPVTEADKAADTYIRKALHEAFPNDKILSEETAQDFNDFTGRVWIVDPIDGTRAYANEEDGFCTIIGLCIDGIPTFGLVYIPLRDAYYYAEKSKGAFVEQQGTVTKLQVSTISDITEARMYGGVYPETTNPIRAFLTALPAKEKLYDGSFGTRICPIAQGNAELYFCSVVALSKWDTCGTQIILEEAGGTITFADGTALDYMQKETKWPKLVISSNGHIHNTILEQVKPVLEEE